MAATTATPRPARDPFEAIPLVAPDVVVEESENGTLILIHRVPVPKKYARLLGRFLGRERESRIVLDEHGTYFWRQINGERNLAEVANAIRLHMNKPEREAKEAVISFTRDLMKRNLIQLKLKA
ncbi:MAG: PqqD family protein [Lentisphaerae bacterium]|nr:PqqD family protein [Lentisphaerota bacterium]